MSRARLAAVMVPLIGLTHLAVASGQGLPAAPLATYVPAFAATQVSAGGPASSPTLRPPSRPIVIEDLLTHTSGLTYGYFGQAPVDSIYRRANLLDQSRTLTQFADSIARL